VDAEVPLHAYFTLQFIADLCMI